MHKGNESMWNVWNLLSSGGLSVIKVWILGRVLESLEITTGDQY